MEHGADMGEQLLNGEGFGEIVIGTVFEQFDSQRGFGAGGEDDDRHGFAARVNLPTYLNAIFSRQYDIQDDNIVVIGAGEIGTLLPIMRDVNGKVFLFQCLF